MITLRDVIMTVLSMLCKGEVDERDQNTLKLLLGFNAMNYFVSLDFIRNDAEIKMIRNRILCLLGLINDLSNDKSLMNDAEYLQKLKVCIYQVYYDMETNDWLFVRSHSEKYREILKRNKEWVS